MSIAIADRGAFGAVRGALAKGVAAAAFAAAAFAFGGTQAQAAGSVSFTSPPDGSSAPVGASITPTGIASGTGTAGSGLDLVLVLDTSGSTGFNNSAGLNAEKNAAKALIGPVPYLWILLRFADDASTPQPTSYFVGQALGGYPSLDHYFREISYGQANLQGSEVQGWFNLPQPRSYDVSDMDPEDPGDEFDATRALNDAVALVIRRVSPVSLRKTSATASSGPFRRFSA